LNSSSRSKTTWRRTMCTSCSRTCSSSSWSRSLTSLWTSSLNNLTRSQVSSTIPAHHLPTFWRAFSVTEIATPNILWQNCSLIAFHFSFSATGIPNGSTRNVQDGVRQADRRGDRLATNSNRLLAQRRRVQEDCPWRQDQRGQESIPLQ